MLNTSLRHETPDLAPYTEELVLRPDLVVGRTALEDASLHAERLIASNRARRRRAETKAIVERKTVKAAKERRARRRALWERRAARMRAAA